MRYFVVLMAMILAGPVAARDMPPLPEKQFASAQAKRAAEDYRAAYAAWRRQRAQYEAAAAAYWERIGKTRSERRQKLAKGGTLSLDDYVLEQPPVYSGPPAPTPPPALTAKPKRKKKAKVRPLPVVADFLGHAKKRFKFEPRKPAGELDYKRAYAKAALAAGIGKEQAVRIYGFEAGGNGGYDVQAGLEAKRKGAKPISTALGYNQLLVANTIGILAEHGETIAERLKRQAEDAKGKRRAELTRKQAALLRMIRYAKSMPYRWSEHEKASLTARGRALHALNLDIDIGPHLQVHKLVNSLVFLQRKGFDRPLSAAELEMMNLTGDGNGYEIVIMPEAMRGKVPTANFFQRNGYERNPVARRTGVVANLIADMENQMARGAQNQGARELAAAF
jgi:hypothetical protein